MPGETDNKASCFPTIAWSCVSSIFGVGKIHFPLSQQPALAPKYENEKAGTISEQDRLHKLQLVLFDYPTDIPRTTMKKLKLVKETEVQVQEYNDSAGTRWQE